ncbi:SPOR domain-containing protein [Vibrio sp. Sgm 22]|uniref:SPOR domain-containing protein n=1 Tax=unclassified Vibrio TaxID=2614977 RepID=UPI0022495BD1|nr:MULTISPECIES: SPOR domain-containing protein [unclassified Vibrio]MCX2757255.1 SPOR domain-containing protein [Vibrio sp. 14G-20]MCX2774203.1 SPOR domain-containing protein [Vibrio sp. Sgm 22]
MKKFAIVTLPLLLAACVSDDYVTNVTSDSYQEEYKTAKVEAPVVSQSQQTSVVEENVVNVVKTESVEQKVTQTTRTKPVATVTGPTQKQQDMNQRFGYTVQVVAVGSQSKVDSFVKMLPTTSQPVWENYKMVNGTKWFTVLYGDYATRLEAKKAISTLPTTFQNLKPFVKSIDDIKNSEYPTLNKLN